MSARKKAQVGIKAITVLAAITSGVGMLSGISPLRLGGLWVCLAGGLILSIDMLWSFIHAIYLYCSRRGTCVPDDRVMGEKDGISCFVCRAKIPPGSSSCVECGWTWGSPQTHTRNDLPETDPR